MTRVTMTSLYSSLNNWTGRLFEATPSTVVTTRSATSFAFSYPGAHDFPGFTITVTGTGFSYRGDDPTAGRITRIVVSNASSQTVLTLDQFTNNGLANDLAQFAANVFGARDTNGDGPGANGEIAWSHMLSGNDVINGTNGNDRTLQGFDIGNDVYNMGAGDDEIAGGMGNDTIRGGDGFDTITFSQTTYNLGGPGFRGISVNMRTGKLIDVWGGVDTFSGIEKVTGSRFNDTFNGSAARDSFEGLRGADVFNGGAEKDRVEYQNDFWQGGRRGIVVDLETSVVNGHIRGTIRDGFGQIDRTIDIERVVGTRFDDTFVGSSDDNKFWGGEGKDSYDGDGGWDAISFGRWFTDQARTGVTVDLSRATNQILNDGFGNRETAISIEEIEGSDLRDRIKGSAGSEFLEGGDGRDTLTGGGGTDEFYWDTQSDIGDGDIITDFAANGVSTRDRLAFNTDEFDGMTTTLRLVNGTAATVAAGQFIFNAANDTLYWDKDGTGPASAVAVVRLTNVDALSAANFELF
ncbi:MAG: calcium-binding protein [Paracoccaceae bacterium]|nr:calcium-binding protein [Paracoccaceae bacterium]